MQVTNNTSARLIAFCWHNERGYGDDTLIEAGETVDVAGPYLGEMGGGSCRVVIQGTIVCHEQPDSEGVFKVAQGNPLHLQGEETGVTVRHHEDFREDHTKGPSILVLQ